jgi:hypothetical protein
MRWLEIKPHPVFITSANEHIGERASHAWVVDGERCAAMSVARENPAPTVTSTTQNALLPMRYAVSMGWLEFLRHPQFITQTI